MDRLAKPFVHLTIDAVDAVILDNDGSYDPELYDHYSTYTEARDAALSSVELMLDERDYDGEDHRDPGSAEQRALHLRHRRRLEQRGDGEPRHQPKDALPSPARAHPGHEGALGRGAFDGPGG